MHELGLAAILVERACEEAAPARVRRIVVEVGMLAAVLPDALRFCFDVVTAGTSAEGATLEIHETPGEGRCRACGALVAMTRPFGRCGCGGNDLEWLRGDELRILAVERGET
jgi:hydrogenase nickel incorporation protein HypA/HybF